MTTPSPPIEPSRIAEIIDLADLEKCARLMAANHGQWRSRISRTVFSGAKDRVVAHRDALRAEGYESVWLNRVAAANFKHPKRDYERILLKPELKVRAEAVGTQGRKAPVDNRP